MTDQIRQPRRLFPVELDVALSLLSHQHPATLEGSADPESDPLHESLEFFAGRRRRPSKLHSFASSDVHPIQHQHMKAKIDVEGRSKPLDQRHGSRVRGAPGHARLLNEEACDGTIHGPEHLGECCRAPQLGQKPRPLLVNATRFSAWQVSERNFRA